jgi:Lrp/AsnC family leucine-responsive transcriptional regulator
MINSLDLKIIAHLMKQGRSTWAELGGILGLSAPAAAERVRKLEESGVIRGYTALIDPEQVGFGLAALVSVTLDRPEHRDKFLAEVQNMAEILECHHVAGEEDYILKVRCSGTRYLERLISDEIKAIPGVLKTKTTVILSTVKETPALPLDLPKEPFN